MKKYWIALILMIPVFAIAASPDLSMCSLSSSNGILDSILSDYYNATSNWKTTLAPTAVKLFWFWFTAEFLWQLTFKKILANDLSKLYVFFVVRIFTAYMFAQIFVDPTFYTGIITYFTNLGSSAGNFSINASSGNPFNSLSPSGIMNIGACMWNSVFGFLDGSSILDIVKAIIFAMPMLLTCLAVFIISALMALGLIMTALEAYIVMNAGIILCGFAGSSWTQSYWQKYLSYVGGVAIRLFVLCLILGLMKTNILAQFSSLTSLASITDFGIAWSIIIKILISMVVYAYLALKVPAMAGAMLTGTVSAGLGDVIAGAAMLMSGASLAKSFMGGGGNNSAQVLKDTINGSGGSLPTQNSSSTTSTQSQITKTSEAQGGKVDSMAKSMGLNDAASQAGNNSQPTTQQQGSNNSSSNQANDKGNTSSNQTPDSNQSSNSQKEKEQSNASKSDSQSGANNSNSSTGTNTSNLSTSSNSPNNGNSSIDANISNSATDSNTPNNSASAIPNSTGSSPSISPNNDFTKSIANGSSSSPTESNGITGAGAKSGISANSNSKTPNKLASAEKFLDQLGKNEAGSHHGAADVQINPHRE